MDAPKPLILRKKPRLKRSLGPWVTARKITQYVALALFFVLFFGTRQSMLAPAITNIPMRLDPLLILSNLLASHTFLAGSALAIILVLGAVVFGRAWCGWLCPLGTILDLFPLERARGTRNPPAENWRKVKYSLLIATLVAALFGNLTLLFLDPLALLTRSLAVSFVPLLDKAVTLVEAGLYRIPALAEPVSVFDGWARSVLLLSTPLFYGNVLLYTLVFVGVIMLNLLAPRFWCRYLCPLGALLGLISKVSIFRRRVDEACKGCVLCTEVCPTGTINPADHYRSDPAECTLCMDCVGTCPRGLNAFSPRFSLEKWEPYDPSRRDALVTIGASAAAVLLLRTNMLAKRQSPFLLRPPGAREKNDDPVSLTQCTRCGECVRICPYGAIQPAALEAGWEGMGTPILNMRAGYCDYACNLCGQVCPVQAIPNLPLEEKQQQVIGSAYIDQNRCIPWSEGQPCLVCEEMCPLPEKAVKMEEMQVWSPEGEPVTVQAPHVLREVCIGCGLCEYKCPVSGEAAIRVYIPPVSVPF